MKNIFSIYCTIVVVLVLSGVSLVPVSAEMNSPITSQGTEMDPALQNEYGITITKVSDTPVGATSVTSTTGKNQNPVVNAAITKMQADGMEVTKTNTALYDISIPDASLEQLKSESASLSDTTGSTLTGTLQAEHPDQFARFSQLQQSTQQNTRHEDGKTISRVEMSAVTFTNQKTGESRNAVIIQTLDTSGHPAGATQVISNPGDQHASFGSIAAQSSVSDEQKKLMDHYSSSCGKWTAGFWFLMAFLLVAAIVAIIVIIYLLLVLFPFLGSAWAVEVGAAVIWASFMLSLYISGTTFLLVVPWISVGALAWGAVGMPKMFIAMKDACTKNEEYGAYQYSPDPGKKGALPASMRPDWKLLDNHRVIAWQSSDSGATTYTGVQSLSDGRSIASGFKGTTKDMNGIVTIFGATGTPKHLVIGQDHVTSINDVRVSPDGSVYLFGITSSGSGPGIAGRTGSASDGIVLKIDPSGTILWSRSIGGDVESAYGFASGAIGSDGTIYAAGATVVSKSSSAGFIAAINPDGSDHTVPAWNNQSSHAFRFTVTSKTNTFVRIQATDDNGLIVAGRVIPSDEKELKGWLLKLDRDKNQEWSVSDGPDTTEFTGVQQATDGSYIVTGTTTKDHWDGGLFTGDREKLGSAGFVMKWSSHGQKTGTVDFSNLMEVSIADIRPAADGGYIVSGLGRINGGPIAGAHGMKDAWVAKLRPDLSIEWQKTLGGENDDAFVSAIEAPDGDVVAVGYTKSNDFDLTARGKKMDGKAAGWIVDLRYDPSKGPDTMDTWLTG